MDDINDKLDIIKDRYLNGHKSIKELSVEYNIPFSIVKDAAAAGRWRAIRDSVGNVIASNDAADLLARRYKKQPKMVGNCANLLLQAIYNGLLDGTIYGYARGLRDITQAIKDISEIKGYKDVGELVEQVARINKLKADTIKATPPAVDDDSERYGVLLLPPVNDAPEPPNTEGDEKNG